MKEEKDWGKLQRGRGTRGGNPLKHTSSENAIVFSNTLYDNLDFLRKEKKMLRLWDILRNPEQS